MSQEIAVPDMETVEVLDYTVDKVDTVDYPGNVPSTEVECEENIQPTTPPQKYRKLSTKTSRMQHDNCPQLLLTREPNILAPQRLRI
uniref:Uncharacterized protein n=1 Tax=Anopheles minimus TaxID=112268 RepID=A0A182VZ57_9DIPT